MRRHFRFIPAQNVIFRLTLSVANFFSRQCGNWRCQVISSLSRDGLAQTGAGEGDPGWMRRGGIRLLWLLTLTAGAGPIDWMRQCPAKPGIIRGWRTGTL